jgi:transcriptional regulator with XRE-family HTH domain
MTKRKIILLPKTQRILDQLGENIRLARLRRGFSAELVSQRADISRPTLTAIEKGSPTVSMGSYLMVLQALGLEKDFLRIAKDDELGRKLQDAKLMVKRRAPKRSDNE